MEFVAFSVFVLYLVPWIVAASRAHERHGAILALNLLLGWTVVGWCAALAWALAQDAPVASRSFQLYAIEGGAASPPPPATPASQEVAHP